MDYKHAGGTNMVEQQTSVKPIPAMGRSELIRELEVHRAGLYCSGMVWILRYEDKHGDKIDVFDSEAALNEHRSYMVRRPGSTFTGTVAVSSQKHEDWKVAVEEGRLDEIWPEFTAFLAEEYSIYLHYCVRKVHRKGEPLEGSPAPWGVGG
jgi:hypothetical protein